MPRSAPARVQVNYLDYESADVRFLEAAKKESLHIVRAILREGAALGAMYASFTALDLAAYRNPDPSVAMFLIEQGLDVCSRNQFGDAPLHGFVRQGQDDLVGRALDAGEDINAITHVGDTPLSLAVANDRLSTAKLLLERGAPCAFRNSTHGYSALHDARSGAMVDVLVAHGACVRRHDESGRTALHTAALCGHAEACAALLAHGVKVDVRSRSRETALSITPHPAIAALLLEAGAEPAAAGRYSTSFAQRAAQDPRLNLVYTGWRARRAMARALGAPSDLRVPGSDESDRRPTGGPAVPSVRAALK